MKIFFTYKLKGSLDNDNKYIKLTEHLKKYGTILSENIRLKNVGVSGQKLSDDQILKRNIDLIKESDVLIADVTNASLGVGYQIHFAKTINKKIICLYNRQVKCELSSIINGDKNLIIINYDDIDDVIIKIDNIICNLKI